MQLPRTLKRRVALATAALGVALASCRRPAPPRPVLVAEPAPAVATAARPAPAVAAVPDAAPPARVFVRNGQAPGAGQLEDALRTQRGERVAVLSPPHALGDGRFVAVTLQGVPPDPSQTVVVAVVSDDPTGRAQVEGRLDVPTEHLYRAWPAPELPDTFAPAVDEVRVGDFDADGHPEAAILVRYGTEPDCGAGYLIKAQFVVVRADPVITLAAAYITQLRSQTATFGPHYSGHVTWSDADHDGHPDLVVTGQSCQGMEYANNDAGEYVGHDTCAPLREVHPWQRATGTWFAGPAPARVPASSAGCGRH